MKLPNIVPEIKYSIIIVSYNTVGIIARCIESIHKHTENFEIIVIDNASTDGSLGYLENLMTEGKIHCLVSNTENRNFGPGNNQGIEHARGETIILLNSDTVVTPEWAERLYTCLKHREDIAIVGPVTNSSNGRQGVQVRPGMPLDAAAYEWGNINGGKWLEAGILYGWCLMLSRSFIELEEYLFDTQFTNSYEDNDLCHRARLRGMKLFIDYGTYIHHEGQASFRKDFNKEFTAKYIENGKLNQELFFNKYRSDKPEKLIAVYRIANCDKYIRESMEQTSKFVDGIICLFARSSDKTKEIALSFPKVIAWEEWNETDHPFDEQAERNWLLQKAIEHGATWVISVDGDEVYEDKFIAMVPRLMKNPNPHVMAYWCNWRTIWDRDFEGNGLYRADGIFGGFQNYRFFKVLPNAKIEKNENIYNHHCGSSPAFPAENLQWLNVRVKHLGYDTPEQRKLKHSFYKKNDPHVLAKDVGNSDYHHLIDSKVDVKLYRENNRISVMSVIRNEEDYIFDMLSNVSPIADEIVIIDNGSTDGTRKEIDRFSKLYNVEVFIFDGKFECDESGMLLNYSEAKNFGKSKCRYEWILQMDADEQFIPREIGNIFAMIDEPVDAYLFTVVNYLEVPKSANLEENRFSISETMRLYRNIDELFYSGLVHESLEDAISVRVMNGKAKVVVSPISIHHRGYLKPKTKLREKVERYHKINQKQFDVSGGKDARPLFNMALHLINEGDNEGALELYRQCLVLEPNFWRASQNLAYHNLELAKKLLVESSKVMPKVMAGQPRFKEIMEILTKHEFVPPKVA